MCALHAFQGFSGTTDAQTTDKNNRQCCEKVTGTTTGKVPYIPTGASMHRMNYDSNVGDILSKCLRVAYPRVLMLVSALLRIEVCRLPAIRCTATIR